MSKTNLQPPRMFSANIKNTDQQVSDASTSQASVELKVLIEQVREQVQNIE